MAAANLLLLLLITPAVIAVSQPVPSPEICPNVKTCLKTLAVAFDTLCLDTSEPPTCSCPVEWESFDLVRVGIVNFQTTALQTFTIPSQVPSTAKEVLVFINVYLGYSQDLISQMKIYTQHSPTRRFEKYLPLKAYNQKAWSTASENMFFPMPQDRHIYLRITRTLPGNVNGIVNVIGYR